MPCVISSPSTDSGKTTLSLLISCWAFSKGIKIQTFKVGPDYLDQQQLSSIGQPICRNLDIFLSGEKWVQKNFLKHSLAYQNGIEPRIDYKDVVITKWPPGERVYGKEA